MDGLRHRPETIVTNLMTITVIHPLEVIDIHKKQRHIAMAATAPLPLVFQNLIEFPPIGDTRELVSKSQLTEFILQAFAFRNIASDDDHVS